MASELNKNEIDSSKIPGWARQGGKQGAGARNILLVYTMASESKMHHKGFEFFLPYVTYVDRDLKPKEPFFDTFLFLPTVSNDEVSFEDYDPSSRLIDWQTYIKLIYNPEYQLAALDHTIAFAKETVHYPGKARVFIGIPYPSTKQRNFGALPNSDQSLNFGDPEKGLENRRQAVQWYIDEVLKRWKESDFKYLDLVGFYWFQESAKEPDFSLIQSVSTELHQKNLKFLWIPWFKATGYNRWKELGFDLCILQPNLSFNKFPPEKYEERLQEASDLARQYGMGLEMEIGSPLDSREVQDKYKVYLNMGFKLGYNKEAVLGYYQDHSYLGTAARSKDPEIRELYDATYRFIKGKESPR